ncbi:UNVERIFIED_CONTAM: hypothetical protein Sindi_1657100 [Sesamum indicum]
MLSKTQSPKIDEENGKMCDIPYASILGNIQFVVQCIRPDIAYALSVTSRYQAYAGEVHWTAVKTIFIGGQLVLDGYSDASFQSDVDDAKSQSNFAEYITTPEAAKEAVLMKNYIQELGVVPNIAEPMVIFCENNGAIAQAKEPRSHHKSIHILRYYHLLLEMVGRVDVRVDHVTLAENTADPLIKTISQVAHTQHLDREGLRQISD